MTQLGKVKYITEADKSRCFICNHLIKDKTPDEGFMLYDVAIHQDCHDNMADFQRIQRNGGMKGFVPGLTHIPNAQVRPAATQPAQPDELKESLGWTEDNREVMTRAGRMGALSLQRETRNPRNENYFNWRETLAFPN